MLAMRTSPQALRHVEALTERVAKGSYEEALTALREMGRESFEGELGAPLVQALCERAGARALEPDWRAASLRFFQMIGLEEDKARCIVSSEMVLHLWPAGADDLTGESAGKEMELACGTRMPVRERGLLGGHGAPRAKRGEWRKARSGSGSIYTICGACSLKEDDFPDCQDAGEAFESVDMGRCDEIMREWLPSELRRGISHLRQDSLEVWLTSCAAQCALSDYAIERLRSPAGEEALHRALGDFTYEGHLKEAQAAGLTGVHGLLTSQEDELNRTVNPLLPSGPGYYDPHDEHTTFSCSPYGMAIARGTEDLARSRASEAEMGTAPA